LSELEAQFFEFAADAMVILYLESMLIVDANQAACGLYGYSRDEFSGWAPRI
jgi:PAS domain S-box-containing protein